MDNEKQIAIMVLTTTKQPIYQELEKCCRETWAKDVIEGKYPNIDYWEVIDTEKESYIDIENKIVYIKPRQEIEKDIRQLMFRWLDAYNLISTIKSYDYIFRMNPSTWINIEWLNIFFSLDIEETIYVINNLFFKNNNYEPISNNGYLAGSIIIWPSGAIEILKNEISNYSYKELTFMDADDIVMSAILRGYLIKNGVQQHKFLGRSFSGRYITEYPEDVNWYNIINIIFCPIIQIATRDVNYPDSSDLKFSIRLRNDKIKMKFLNILWKIYRNLIDQDTLKNIIINYKNTKMGGYITIPFPTEKELEGLRFLEHIEK